MGQDNDGKKDKEDKKKDGEEDPRSADRRKREEDVSDMAGNRKCLFGKLPTTGCFSDQE